MADLCTMCESAPATTVWGFPVCQDCADGLDSTQAMLQEMEADDPVLKALGERVEDAVRAFQEVPAAVREAIADAVETDAIGSTEEADRG